MKNLRLMLFNGFLGAGKTTLMTATAAALKEQGIKVSLITNDLGENLVDTNYARLSGIPVAEIPNGCLCHDVDNFVRVMEEVIERDDPDYIFAEPVGSCVGLVESVYKVLAGFHADFAELAPFVVVVDPARYRSIYLDEGNNSFNDEATYMYKKQLEESDLIVLNKIDTIDGREKEALVTSLKENFPDRPVVCISAAEKTNLDEWMSAFLSGQQAALRDNDIDWPYLNNGNEHMGWYNSTLQCFSLKQVDYNAVIECLTEQIRLCFVNLDCEIAHLKVLASDGAHFARAAVTANAQHTVFSDTLPARCGAVMLCINMRAIAPPEVLARAVNTAVKNTASLFDLRLSAYHEQAFNCFENAPEATDVCDCGDGCCCC